MDKISKALKKFSSKENKLVKLILEKIKKGGVDIDDVLK